MVILNDELIRYIKDSTPPGTWYNCQSRDGNASFLFDILKIPDVSESEFDRLRKGSKLVASHVDGVCGIYTDTYKKKLHIAHTIAPNHRAAQASESQRRHRLGGWYPKIPDRYRDNYEKTSDLNDNNSSGNSGVSPMGIHVTSNPVDAHNESTPGNSAAPVAFISMETDPKSQSKTPVAHDIDDADAAANAFTSGTPAEIKIGDCVLKLRYHSTSNAGSQFNKKPGVVEEAILASLLRTFEEYPTDRKGIINPRATLNQGKRSRVYMRHIQSDGSSLKPKQLQRHAAIHRNSLSVMSGGNETTMTEIVARALRTNPEIWKRVLGCAGVPLSHKMTPTRAAAMIEDCNINPTVYMKVRLWLEAEFPELRSTFPSKQKIKELTKKIADAIAMDTGTIMLHSKKDHDKMVKVSFAGVVSYAQALLVTAHQSFNAGKKQLAGAPKGEVWGQDSCDAGQATNKYHHKWILGNEKTRMQSIREITTLCLYSSPGTADDFPNHKIAFWDRYAADRNRLAYGAVLLRVELNGNHIAPFFLTDYTPAPMAPLILTSSIKPAMLNKLRNDGQTWYAPAGGLIVLLTSEDEDGFVGIASVELPDLGCEFLNESLLGYLWDARSADQRRIYILQAGSS